MISCPECNHKTAKSGVELITEPFEGQSLEYGSQYNICVNRECRITWYDRKQMQDQLKNRTRALNGT